METKRKRVNLHTESMEGEGMECAREGDQLREDFLEAIAQNILLDIKLAVSSSIHEAAQKSHPSSPTGIHTYMRRLYPSSKVRSRGCFAGATVNRYPTPKVRETQVRW